MNLKEGCIALPRDIAWFDWNYKSINLSIWLGGKRWFSVRRRRNDGNWWFWERPRIGGHEDRWWVSLSSRDDRWSLPLGPIYIVWENMK